MQDIRIHQEKFAGAVEPNQLDSRGSRVLFKPLTGRINYLSTSQDQIHQSEAMAVLSPEKPVVPYICPAARPPKAASKHRKDHGRFKRLIISSSAPEQPTI
jgi:hypothetical protein